MKPKIIVDSISLLSSLTGIGRYTYEVSKRIKEKNDFKSNYFYGYHSKKLLHTSDTKNTNFLKSFIIKNQLVKKIVRKIIMISSKISSPKYDLYWQPNFIPNEGIKAKKIVTSVHDFSFILHKDFHPKERIEHLENNFFKNILKSDIIITGSAFTKQEVINTLDIDENKIKVIHHGVDHELFYIRHDLKLNHKLPKKFILCVGSIEPRKNLLGLLKAYEMLDVELKKEYKLVLAGFKGWENQEIMNIINNNKQNIHYLGFVSDIELSKIYNLASCFIYPSFYEGFGIPPLEAMACGTPVIVSNSSSIPEVCGDAVLYIDPNNTKDIMTKITTLLLNKTLQQELVQKGLQKTEEYSWEKSAQKHLEIMNSF